MTSRSGHVHIEPRGAGAVLRYDDGRVVIVGTKEQLEAVLFGARPRYTDEPLPRLYEKPGLFQSWGDVLRMVAWVALAVTAFLALTWGQPW